MKYVSEAYQAQLDTLAENLMAAKREQLARPAGELIVLAEVNSQYPDLPETQATYAA